MNIEMKKTGLDVSDLITLVQRKGGGNTGFPYKSFMRSYHIDNGILLFSIPALLYYQKRTKPSRGEVKSTPDL